MSSLMWTEFAYSILALPNLGSKMMSVAIMPTIITNIASLCSSISYLHVLPTTISELFPGITDMSLHTTLVVDELCSIALLNHCSIALSPTSAHNSLHECDVSAKLLSNMRSAVFHKSARLQFRNCSVMRSKHRGRIVLSSASAEVPLNLLHVSLSTGHLLVRQLDQGLSLLFQ